MNGIVALGYVILATPKVDEWHEFSTGVLGLQSVRNEDHLLLRCDERSYRLRIDRADEDSVTAIGWEVASEEDLNEVATRLEEDGYVVKRGDSELARARQVSALIGTEDPSGHKIEIFHGLTIDKDSFVSPIGARFVTDPLGFGHAFMTVDDVPKTRQFYVDILGMRVSDRMAFGEHDAYFLRCNPRHHSLGFASRPGIPARLLHLMFEVDDFDVVGRTYFNNADRGEPLTTTLGRHSNDRMFSYYVQCPSGFDIEFGWGGLQLDEATYVEKRIDVESFWGHRRTEHNIRGPQSGSDL